MPRFEEVEHEEEGLRVAKHKIPEVEDFYWPILKALEAKGGTATQQEVLEQVSSDMKIPDEILQVPFSCGPHLAVETHCYFACGALEFYGALEKTPNDLWVLTKQGQRISGDQEARDFMDQRWKERMLDPEGFDRTKQSWRSWREELLDIIRAIEPDAFERLCQRVLRESGFTKVNITGRSGDGGIDGAGVLRINLLSFHVRFQCKRYTGAVGASAVRDFRGAMTGRADKGLFITTGRFTKDAKSEAVRDSAQAIDLIDGLELCELLKKLELGVKTESVEVITPNEEFFSAL